MAATQLTVKTISFGTLAAGKYPGVNLATLDTPEATGNYFIDDNRTFFFAKSASTTITITVDATHASDEGITTDVVVDVASGEHRAFGPFGSRFLDVNGYVQVTYSAITGLTVAAVKLAEKGRG